MPELPEVETICSHLRPLLIERHFEEVKLFRPNLRYAFCDNFCSLLVNTVIKKVYRRSKYLLIEFIENYILIIHLGMSGRVRIDKGENQRKHDHVFFQLSNGQGFFYNDPRRFGFMTIISQDEIENHPYFYRLGPEPLGDLFTSSYLQNALNSKKASIKASLLNQQIVAGLGNIYVCEALFQAHIHPERSSNTLQQAELKKLIPVIRNVLRNAIAAGGSTLKDYSHPDGKMGYFQYSFDVYGQEGKPCKVCSYPIQKINQHGRSTFFCKKCQH